MSTDLNTTPSQPVQRRRTIELSRPELALLAVTAVWGATFLIVHTAMSHSGPMFFVGLRFVAAGFFALLIFGRTLRGATWADLAAGSAIGVAIFFGYGLQTVGLQSISSSTSAFITALYVPMVPLLQWAVWRKAPGAFALTGVGLAFVGLLLVAGPAATSLEGGTGELITLVGAVAIAAEIIFISAFAGRFDLGRISIIQLLVAGALAFVTMPVTGEHVPEFSWVWLSAGLGLGLASCLIQVTMNWAQKSVSPTRATIIYAGEPVWAGAIGRLAGERLPALALVGAVLIVASVIVSELRPTGRTPRTPEGEPAPT